MREHETNPDHTETCGRCAHKRVTHILKKEISRCKAPSCLCEDYTESKQKIS